MGARGAGEVVNGRVGDAKEVACIFCFDCLRGFGLGVASTAGDAEIRELVARVRLRLAMKGGTSELAIMDGLKGVDFWNKRSLNRERRVNGNVLLQKPSSRSLQVVG